LSELGKPIIVQNGHGKDLHAFGDVVTVVIPGEQSENRFSLMLDTTPPGGGPPPHIHHKEDELFLVIEGRISYFADGKWTEVGPGGAVYLPRGTVHTFRNVGTSPSRHWVLTTPSGFERFFALCAEEFAKPSGPDMNRIVEISREHGIEIIEKINE
jgi:quercetin dioxygenase-like cupin family protein